MKRNLSLILIIGVAIFGCTKNAITGRRQLTLVSENALQQQALTQYKTFLSANSVVKDANSKDAEMVRRVGNRIAVAITKYYASKGLSSALEGYKWEFNLVNNKEVNAWCMPGGKVVVYTGLLSITQNEDALAIVLGHEITHAVVHHGQERMSQAMIAQGLQLTGDVLTSGDPKVNNIFNGIYAPSAQIGVLLPNSRNQELEADHYGLLFAAMAGYNPREAIPFWTRMSELNKGAKTPEFLSDHPVDSKRIEKLQGFMEEAMSYYKSSK